MYRNSYIKMLRRHEGDVQRFIVDLVFVTRGRIIDPVDDTYLLVKSDNSVIFRFTIFIRDAYRDIFLDKIKDKLKILGFYF